MTRFDPGSIRWRLLAANLVVAGGAILAVGAGVWVTAPTAFEQAMGMDGGMMGSGMNGGGMMDPALRAAFGDAVGTALLLGLAAAVVIAVLLAIVLSAGISRPIATLSAASRRVARGDYAQRVPEAGGEVGALARSFNEMAAALELNEQRRLDLVGDVAHELRTPIASVRGYVEGLEAGVFEPGPDTWRVLDAETARLARLVDDLATLWRAESHDLALAPEPLDGPTVLADTVERHRPLAISRTVELELGQVEPVIVRADRTRLDQVLDNLVGNALRYTPATGHVALGLVARDEQAVLTVRDDGPGFTGDQAKRIFDRFYRAESSRSRDAGGSGLGLAIARSLVEAMGGSIAASSEGQGRGSTFTVRLPASQSPR